MALAPGRALLGDHTPTDASAPAGSLLAALAAGAKLDLPHQVEAAGGGDSALLLVYPALDLCFGTQSPERLAVSEHLRFRLTSRPPLPYDRRMHQQFHWLSLRQLTWFVAIHGFATELVEPRAATSLCRVTRWPNPGKLDFPGEFESVVARMAQLGVTLEQMQREFGLSRPAACRLINVLSLQRCLQLEAVEPPPPARPRLPHRHAGMFNRIRAALGI